MPAAIIALAFSMFTIGTTEFVVVGILPDISGSFHVPIATAGLLVTSYAIGIAVAGPVLVAVTGRFERKRLLLFWMGIFILANLATAFAPSFGILVIARVLASFSHASFVATAVALALGLVDENRRGKAVAVLFGGLTVALVVGVPLGALLGDHWGWRSPFVAISALGFLALVLNWALLRPVQPGPSVGLGRQLRLAVRPRLLVALLVAALGFAANLLAYTYISPLLIRVTDVAPSAVSAVLIVFGAAAAAGTFAAGPIGDRFPSSSPAGGLFGLAAALILVGAVAHSLAGTLVALVLWGAVGFGMATFLQLLVVAAAPDIPQIAASLTVSAFNVGIAAGSFGGGRVVNWFGVGATPYFGAVVAVAGGVVAALIAYRIRRDGPAQMHPGQEPAPDEVDTTT
ncbi:MFS transporter [Gryllotalpicola protaetiae]|uniref:MFS transporter n=1 Tax=Gryllotalpicola protaetiae TaxID=2419771 RepID=A0A387BPC6_9MICO|nr:MFS transporter [Gryllotalpicola protaetiae]AYG03904.1 MFS transporter [Gryllotalpicola protaetiae]